MRIAVIADIHGNSFALEAVLEDIARQSVDEIVIAGDTINCLPNSRQCWELVKALGCPVLQGNHEYYVYTLATPQAPEYWDLDRFQPTRWTAGQFSPQEKTQMQNLPWHWELPGLFITHASQRNLFDTVSLETSAEELQTFFPTTQAAVIVRGHNHGWRQNIWNQRVVLTVNSCGIPLDNVDLFAPYLILTQRNGWEYQKRHVEYDHASALQTMNAEYIHNVGPLGLIFRKELETSASHLGSFFGQYLDAVDSQEITLQTAVERYLAENA